MRLLRCVPPALLAVSALAGASPAGEQARTDRRGDPLPAGAVARLGSSRLRADGTVQCLAFTPDGKALVSGGASNSLTFWDTATGREVRRLTFTSPNPNVYSLQLTADGKSLALGCGDGVVRILDAGTGRERKALVDPVRRFGNVYAVLSPDGKHLVSSASWGRELLLWDVEGGRVRQRYAGFDGFSTAIPAAFTPDGKHLVAAWTDRKLHVLDAETGKDLRALEGSAPAGGATYYRIPAVAVSPDGKRVALPDSTGRSLLLLDLASGKLARRIDKPTTGGYYYGGTRALAFTPNGRFLYELGGSGSSVHVWGVASGKLLRHLQAGTGYYSSNPVLAVSRDGKRAATASGSVIHLWDVPGDKALHETDGHQGAVMRLAFLRGGKLVSAGNNHLRAWDVAAMKQTASVPLARAGFGVQYLGTSPGGKGVRWLGSNRTLYEWTPGEREPRQFTTPRTTPYFYQSALSPDGRTMAVLDNAGKFFLVDLLSDRKDRQLVAKLENRFGSPAIVFSPDGRRVALGTPDRVVRVWDVASGTELRGLRPDAPGPGFYSTARLEFSPDGRTLLKLENDGSLHGYEVAGGGERFRLPRAASYTQQFCFSPDGRLVARAGGDGVVTVFDTLTGKELATRDGKQGGIQSLAFSPDGKQLATGGTNTTVLVWEVPAPPPAGKGAPDADGAWSALGEADAGKAFRAVADLAASPAESVKLIRARLKPPAAADAKKVEKLIADLDNEDFDVRQKATEELAALGTEAEDALRKAATSPSPEVRTRVRKLLGKLSAGGVPVTRLRTIRAVEALERIGTPAARAVLKGLLKAKPEGAIEQEVRGGLARLGER